MPETLTGGCPRGEIQYRFEGEPIELTVCHCRPRQRQSGSAFGMSPSIPAEAFELPWEPQVLRGRLR